MFVCLPGLPPGICPRAQGFCFACERDRVSHSVQTNSNLSRLSIRSTGTAQYRALLSRIARSTLGFSYNNPPKVSYEKAEIDIDLAKAQMSISSLRNALAQMSRQTVRVLPFSTIEPFGDLPTNEHLRRSPGNRSKRSSG